MEPFAGSLAVLLASDPHDREVVCDTSGHICNFWRALRADPEAVAYHADYPTYHDDLTARHIWLNEWAEEQAHNLRSDPEWYDAKAAGWWVWGISSWIGSGWCTGANTWAQRPHIGMGGGEGISAQRDNTPNPQIPFTHHGMGVQVQKRVSSQIPLVGGREGGAKGVSAQRDQMPRLGNTGAQGVAPQRNKVPQANKGVNNKRPQLSNAGQGVQAHRPIHNKRPNMGHHSISRGVQAQRKVHDKRPEIKPHNTGRGVQAQVVTEEDIGTGERLLPWFLSLIHI